MEGFMKILSGICRLRWRQIPVRIPEFAEMTSEDKFLTRHSTPA